MVIDQVLAKNPKAAICGLTATPNRGDGKGLREVFSNVADQISLGEMIASGHLVSPRTFVIDVGAQEALQNVRRTAIDFDMEQVATILNKSLITDAVIAHWKQKAADRKTIVFCSTVAHAQSVCEAFVASGVSSVLIHGELSPVERQTRLQAFETGSAQVVVNVAVSSPGKRQEPEVVFCVNDAMALGMLDAVRFSLMRRVPRDISIVGFDDIPTGRRPAYLLTTVSQPFEEMARLAVQILRSQVDNLNAPNQRELLHGRLVERNSAMLLPIELY